MKGVKTELVRCFVRSALCLWNVWESPFQEGECIPKWIPVGFLAPLGTMCPHTGHSRQPGSSWAKKPSEMTWAFHRQDILALACPSYAWGGRDPTMVFVIRWLCVASSWRRAAGVGAKCSLCRGTGTGWGPGSGPSLPDAALAVHASLALCWTSNTASCVIFVLIILFLLPGSHIVEHHKMPSYFTATSNSQLGNTFSSQKRCFPPQLKSTFMVSGEAMRLWVAAKANRSQCVVFSGFLLYWREKQQEIRGSQQRRGSPGRTWQPTCSVHTQPLSADEPNGDI